MNVRKLGTTGNAKLLGAGVNNVQQLRKNQAGVTLELDGIGTLADGKLTDVSFRDGLTLVCVNFVDGSQIDLELKPNFKGTYLVRLT